MKIEAKISEICSVDGQVKKNYRALLSRPTLNLLKEYLAALDVIQK